MTDFMCPHCKKLVKVEGSPGSVAPCPKCSKRFRLPRAPQAAIAAGPAVPTSSAAAFIDTPDEDEAKLRAALPWSFPREAAQLGVPRYRVETAPNASPKAEEGFAGLMVTGLGALAFFALAVNRIKDYIFDRANNFPPGAGFPWFPLIAIFVALPIGVGLCWLAVRIELNALRERRTFAVVYPEGFVVSAWGRYKIWKWSDIVGVCIQNFEITSVHLFGDVCKFRTRFYRLIHRDGSFYDFLNTWGPRALQFGFQVERETYQRMMPDVRARLAAGEAVKFGPLEMDANGLTYRGKLASWSRIGPARIEKGALLLDGLGPRGSEVRIMLGDLPNSHVFLPLLEEKVGFEED